jgi:hypothetical protein
MSSRSKSHSFLFTLLAVGLALLVFAWTAAASGGEISTEFTVWLLSLRSLVSVVGAAVAITALLHYVLKTLARGETAPAALPQFVVPFLAGCALWDAGWAALFSLAAVAIAQLIIGYLSTDLGSREPAALPPTKPTS